MNRKQFISLSILFVIALFSSPQLAFAHRFSYAVIQTKLEVQDNVIHMHMDIPEVVLARDIETNGNQSLQALASADPTIFFADYFPKHLAVLEDGKVCSFSLTQYVPGGFEVKKSTFSGDFKCPHTISTINDLSIINFAFYDYFQTYDNFVVVTIDSKNWEIVFNRKGSNYPSQVTATETGTLKSDFLVTIHFLWMGIIHILTGYDHILFLLSVILLIRSFKKITILVTSFTIAHSITFFLVCFHVIAVPEIIVEPLIAFSIICMVFLNVQTLLSTKKDIEVSLYMKERWATVFGFGLIHGLGFASALTDTQIPQTFFVPSLLFFNLGIEVGQLGIFAILLPVLLRVDEAQSRNKILGIISAIVCIIAAYWFFQRVSIL